MNKSTSLYLDFLRIIAAFGVLLVHASLPWFSDNLFFSEKYGHKFVMIFFVLSGYLIAFTVNEKNKGAKRYIVDRISRLYSVVWPALLLTCILDYIGIHFNRDFYLREINFNHQFLRYLVNAVFLGQIWSLCTIPSTNGPFWSICYEFWYYMLFAVYCYLGGAKKYVGIGLICLLIGYKILLLFPVWIFGVVAYNITKHGTAKKRVSQILFVFTSFSVIILTFFWDFTFFSAPINPVSPLYFSAQFGFDWIYGGLVAVNLYSFSSVVADIKIAAPITNIIKYLSSITFSVYLFQLPMLALIGALVPYNKHSYWQILLLLVGLVLVIALLAEITEKQRRIWKAIIDNIISLVYKKPMPAQKEY